MIKGEKIIAWKSLHKNTHKNYHVNVIGTRATLCNCIAHMRLVNLKNGKSYSLFLGKSKGRLTDKIIRSKYNIKLEEDRNWERELKKKHEQK